MFPRQRTTKQKPLYSKTSYCIRSRVKISFARFDRSFRFFSIAYRLRFVLRSADFSVAVRISRTMIPSANLLVKRKLICIYFLFIVHILFIRNPRGSYDWLDDLSTKGRLLKTNKIKASISCRINIWQVFSVGFPFLFSIQIPSPSPSIFGCD